MFSHQLIYFLFVSSKLLITKPSWSIAKTIGPLTLVFTWRFRNFMAFCLFSQIFSEKGKMAMMLKVFFLKSGFYIMCILTCLNSILLSLPLYNACSSLKLLYTTSNSPYCENTIRPTCDHKRGFSNKFMCLHMKILKLLNRFEHIFFSQFQVCFFIYFLNLFIFNFLRIRFL